MTHPDILITERFGYVDYPKNAVKIGECHYCGANLYDDNIESVESIDGRFCDIDCCHEFYEIRHVG